MTPPTPHRLTKPVSSANSPAVRRLLLVGLLVLPALVGCAPSPTLLVCESVRESPDGPRVCVRPTTQLQGGTGYTLFATGRGLPTGRVRIAVDGVRATGAATTASNTISVGEGDASFTSPLRLLYEGDYRITVRGEDGELFQEARVHVSRPPIHVVSPLGI